MLVRRQIQDFPERGVNPKEGVAGRQPIIQQNFPENENYWAERGDGLGGEFRGVTFKICLCRSATAVPKAENPGSATGLTRWSLSEGVTADSVVPPFGPENGPYRFPILLQQKYAQNVPGKTVYLQNSVVCSIIDINITLCVRGQGHWFNIDTID